MCDFEFYIKLAVAVVAIASFIWGLFLYWESHKSKKVDNLDKFWVDNLKPDNHFMDLFEKLDTLATVIDKHGLDSPEAKAAKTDVVNVDKKAKLSFLSFLDRVAIYYKEDQLIKEDALYKFHWYFNYVYTNTSTSEAFWYNFDNQKEIESHSWEASKKMADDCAVYMKSNGIS